MFNAGLLLVTECFQGVVLHCCFFYRSKYSLHHCLITVMWSRLQRYSLFLQAEYIQDLREITATKLSHSETGSNISSELDISNSVVVFPPTIKSSAWKSPCSILVTRQKKYEMWPWLYASWFSVWHSGVLRLPSVRNCYLCLFYNWFHPVWLQNTGASLDSQGQHNRSATCSILRFV